MESLFADQTAFDNRKHFLSRCQYGLFFLRHYLIYAEEDRDIAAWMQVSEKGNGEWGVVNGCEQDVGILVLSKTKHCHIKKMFHLRSKPYVR